MHKRRVSLAATHGEATVDACDDCYEAFRSKTPWLCKYCLANDMWLGRWDPLFRGANLSHQMLLALGRVVTTKVILRPGGITKANEAAANRWDFLFHQSGIIGSAAVFSNAACGSALDTFPDCRNLQDTFAVSFVVQPDAPSDDTGTTDEQKDGLREDGLPLPDRLRTRAARAAVSRIAKLMVNRTEFDSQATALQNTNVVFHHTI